MSIKPLAAQIEKTTPTIRQKIPAKLGDLRFRKLLGTDAWNRLPPAIQRRFSKRLKDGHTVVYVGHITDMRMNWAGIVLTQLTRLIGSPLPLSSDTGVPSVVTVTEDRLTGGQIWTRLYARSRKFPQVIHSSKQFSGPTGLEEHVGFGIGMALRLTASKAALTFNSNHYFIALGYWRLTLPNWLTPGRLTVGHREIDPDHFAFTLELAHPLFGELIYQEAVFHEADHSASCNASIANQI